jgi:two-component system, OmpR family, response regulator
MQNTILCIDDEPLALELRCKLLAKAGYRVLVAASPEEGISLFGSERVDLVVLDYWMPDLKGIAVAERLKSMNPEVPIVILSGFRPIFDEGIGLADRWLLKGESDPEDLLTAVSELLHRAQSR